MRQVLTFWLCLLRDMVVYFTRDDCAFLAAGIAFYAFFSIFPLALLCVTAVGYLLSLPWLHDQVVLAFSQLTDSGAGGPADGLTYTLRLVHSLVPAETGWLEDELKVLATHWGRNVLVSLLVGLWSGRQMFSAMEYSLHRAWDMPLKRSWVRRNLLAMALIPVCGGTAFLTLVLIAFLSVVEEVMARFQLPSFAGFSLDQALLWSWFISWIVVPLAVGVIFLMLYRFLPSEPIPLGFAVPGAVFSAVAWRLSSQLYVEYAFRFGSISMVYGSIWYIVGLMIWLYIVAAVFLLGAELVYAYTHIRTGSRKSPGHRYTDPVVINPDPAPPPRPDSAPA